MIVGLIVGAGIFGTPSIVAGARRQRNAAHRRVDRGRRLLDHRRAVLCRARDRFPVGGRRVSLPPAGLRALARVPLRLGAHDGDRRGLDRGVRVSLRRLHVARRQSRARIRRRSGRRSSWSCSRIVNYVGIREGKATQNLFTVLEVGGLVLIVVAGLLLAPAPAAAPAPAGAARPWIPWTPGIGIAMLFVLFTYGGWNDAAYISAEVRDRERNMVRALLIAIGLVTVLYVLREPRLPEGPRLRRDGALGRGRRRSAEGVWGQTGEKVICDHDRDCRADVGERLDHRRRALQLRARPRLAGARLPRALGRGSGSPRAAMLVQGAIALALVAFGAIQDAGFKRLVGNHCPVFWGFFLLVPASRCSCCARRSRNAAAVPRAGYTRSCRRSSS